MVPRPWVTRYHNRGTIEQLIEIFFVFFRHKKYRTRINHYAETNDVYRMRHLWKILSGPFTVEERFDDASIYQSDIDFACFQLLYPIRCACRFQTKSHKISN